MKQFTAQCLVIVSLLTLLSAVTRASEHLNKQIYFGDTHVHSSYSFDAYIYQNRDADPDTAYRWAKGRPVIHPYSRARVQINTPLDFLVVADHAEFLGVLPAIKNDSTEFGELDWWGDLKRRLAFWTVKRAMNDPDKFSKIFSKYSPKGSDNPGGDPVVDPNNKPLGAGVAVLGSTDRVRGGAWQAIIRAAERHNDPGEFTTFIGWEWSSVPVGANLHRVVFTPDDGSVASQFLPYGADQSQYPQDLWDWLNQTSAQTGARFIAIPHNSNLSKGYMFADTTLKGRKIDARYARIRAQLEPVVEITQTKGDSETHPVLSPEDEFANFEGYPFYLQGNLEPYKATPADYVRSGLKTGLQIFERTGVNPYEFGVIGSTDSHTGLSSAEETNFWGKVAVDSIPENKMGGLFGESSAVGWTMSASGLAAVWAEFNTREAIYAAFMRREVYGTTGSRIKVRVFGGWDFPELSHQSIDFAGIGYARGVPMGGTLEARAAALTGKVAPQFIVQALKDPDGANLDQIQIIKGWVDEAGVGHEKIYPLAWSGKRQIDTSGKLEAVGNTVDVSRGSYKNNVGSSSLSAYWADPDFDPKHAAFYYVRVLEIPTPRHSLLDAIALKQEPSKGYPATIQERAYTSSIWYRPDF